VPEKINENVVDIPRLDTIVLGAELNVDLRYNVFVWGIRPLVEDDFSVFANNTLSYSHLISSSDNFFDIHILAHSPQWRHLFIRRRSVSLHILPTQFFEDGFDFIQRGTLVFLIHRVR
jgi:hypothetical protein